MRILFGRNAGFQTRKARHAGVFLELFEDEDDQISAK